MKKYYSDETKNQTVQEFINGKSVSKIHAETGISRSTIYSWIESQKESLTKAEKINLRDYRELVTKCERQQKNHSNFKGLALHCFISIKRKIQCD